MSYQTKNVRMATPWGTSDFKVEYQRGLFMINTPGHGGIAVSAGLANKILSPKAIRLAGQVMGGYVFFEEDCAVCVAALDSELILSHIAIRNNVSNDELRNDMIKSVSRWFPNYFTDAA